MRFVLGVAALFLGGCASTVYRVGGEPITPGGVATTACESKDWLVIAPTRAEVTNHRKKTSHPESGLGLYRVGENSPESIPSIDDLQSPSVDAKRLDLAPYERRQIIAGGLGAASILAIAVGTIVFVNAFQSRSVLNADGSRREDNSVNGGTAALGGVLVGVGFGLGIGGLVVNPSHADRTRANATKYVFFDPPDDQKTVEDMVQKHNADVRHECAATAP
jgi:hypothetical protein